MMSKPSDTPGFKALQKEWQKKLKDSGFKDIELTNGELRKSGTEHRFMQASPLEREAKATYFEIVNEKLVQTMGSPNPSQTQMYFCSDFTHLELQVMELHADGYSQAEIARRLGIRGRSPIYRALYKWLKLWGLKK